MNPALDMPDLPGALCAQVGSGSDLWFPGKRDNRTANAARRICRACPAITACLTYALADPSLDGVWAATTPRERQLLRRRVRQGTPTASIAHDTMTGTDVTPTATVAGAAGVTDHSKEVAR